LQILLKHGKHERGLGWYQAQKKVLFAWHHPGPRPIFTEQQPRAHT
jgi:hypothetical protein